MNAHLFDTAELAKTFILAGDARFTLVSKKTGQRFTYRVTGKREGGGVRRARGPLLAMGPHFVSLLRGSDNENDYTFLGTIFSTERVVTGGSHLGRVYGNVPTRTPKYVPGKKSKVSPDAPSAKAFAWAWGYIARGELPPGCEVWHEGRCGRCGRALTVPESIASGIGPVCEDAAA